MERVNIDFERFKSFLLKYKFVVGAFVFLLVIGIVLIPRAFAQPVKSVEITSDSADYEKKDSGAWKVDKSAKWTSRGEAEITFDVDTIMKSNNKYTDVLFVLDVSGSMNGDKLNRVKADSIELIESLLSNGDNKAGLITFGSTSNIVLDFTKDEELLKEKINSLITTGCTNYYQALVNVDEVLKNYKKEKGRECIVLFLTDGYPNQDTPNEETQYNYLKQQYPFITINGIQYEMGSNVLDPVKKVSDNQFIADMDTLNNVLFDASAVGAIYDNFELTDYVDTNYFYVDDEDDIKVSQGIIGFDIGTQKISWTMDDLKSGSSANMTIKAKLKDKFIGKGGLYTTNKRVKVKSILEDKEENVESQNSPILADNYKVIYDGNAPKGCNVEGVPSDKYYSVFDTVEIDKNIPVCDGYYFKGWQVITKNVDRQSDDYFIMSEKDVLLRAKWSKLSIDKAMDGEVHEYEPTLKKVTMSTWHYSDSTEQIDAIEYSSPLHDKYKYNLKKIIFQNELNPIDEAVDVIDLSENENGEVLAYLVPCEDDNSKYTAYIQAAGRIKANSDSSYLFAGYGSLESIEGLENLNTSGVTKMTAMFGSSNIKELDISSLDTSNVEDMSWMFAPLAGFNHNCYIPKDYEVSKSSLINLNIGNIDTSKVTKMMGMFGGTTMSNSQLDTIFSKLNISNVIDMSYFFSSSSLETFTFENLDYSNVIDISGMFAWSNITSVVFNQNFKATKVKNISRLFKGCNELLTVNFNGLNALNLANMNSLFSDCSNLIDVDLSYLDTSNVVDMSYMFSSCRNLLNVVFGDRFSTVSVKDVSYMFMYCEKLSSLNLSNFDTSKVENMQGMFFTCRSLVNLNIEKFKTTSATDMSYMFNRCGNLVSLDVSNFDTSKVTKMAYMFEGCSKLTGLDVSSFDTSNVTSMSCMFGRCSKLTGLDVSRFDTSNVIDISSMFYGCSALTSLDVSSFNISNVIDISSMFWGCSGLTSLDLRYLDISKAENISGLFGMCIGLTNLDLSNFNTLNVTNMSSIFSGCSGLTNLDLSNFDTSSVKNMSSMFEDCTALTNLDLSSFNTSSVTSMWELFSGCSSLTSLDLSSFDTSSVTDMSYMFKGCINLTSLDLSSFDTNNVTRMQGMFNGCSNLSTTLTIINDITYYFDDMFCEAATTGGAKIVVNYSEDIVDKIDDFIATKSDNSNVVKGEIIHKKTITIVGNDDIVPSYIEAYPNKTVRLNSKSGNFIVRSFKMNGSLIKGNKFKVSEENVSITDITVESAFIVQSEHNPYPNDLDFKVYAEKRFPGAISLTVDLDYQTEYIWSDYIYLYDGNGKEYGSYGGTTRKIETIEIPGDYIKIVFRTDSYRNDYYGFRASIAPNYD